MIKKFLIDGAGHELLEIEIMRGKQFKSKQANKVVTGMITSQNVDIYNDFKNHCLHIVLSSHPHMCVSI